MNRSKSYDKFDRYYTSLRLMGADRVLRDYLDLSSKQVLPFAISHGVDFGYLNINFEEYANEPIQIVHTEQQAESISKHKSVLRFPHPWLLLKPEQRLSPIHNLVIGPPPSHRNYLRLYQHFKSELKIDKFTLLVKQRNHLEYHSKFLQDQGVDFVSAGEAKSPSFYEDLYIILSSCEFIYSIYPSSAIFFGAALGKKIVLIDQVNYDCISDHPIAEVDTRDPLKLRRCKEILMVVSQNDRSSKIMARELLGEQYLESKENLRNRLFEAMEQCEGLLYHNKKVILRRAQGAIPSFFLVASFYLRRISLDSLVKLFKRSRLGLVDITYRNDFRVMGFGTAFTMRTVTIRRFWLRRNSNLGAGFEVSFMLSCLRLLRRYIVRLIHSVKGK